MHGEASPTIRWLFLQNRYHFTKQWKACLKHAEGLVCMYRGRRKDFLIRGAQSETTHRVVSNLYNNL